MGKYITVKVMRSGTQVYASVFLQLDNMGAMEASYYTGATPYYRLNAYMLANLDIRRGDLFVDLVNTDPKTGGPTQYRVISMGENFPDSHTECVVDLVVGV